MKLSVSMDMKYYYIYLHTGNEEIILHQTTDKGRHDLMWAQLNIYYVWLKEQEDANE